MNSLHDTIIALEKSALDRWGNGDPQGYLETYTPEVTYFDPFAATRVDGLQAMTDYLAPITGKVNVDRYEMIGAVVQPAGDAAVLSYQLVSHAILPDGSRYIARWNSTKVYVPTPNGWNILHDHWSFIQPELKNAPSGAV